jgi:hypothetical protein
MLEGKDLFVYFVLCSSNLMVTLLLLLRSLLLTGILAFLAPILLITGMFSLLYLIEHLPKLDKFGHWGIQQFIHILTIFGGGSPFYGVLTIALVCSLVGILFDTYTLYRYPRLEATSEK